MSWRPVGRPQAFRELCRGFELTQRRFPPPLGQRVFSRRRRHAESRTRPLPRTFARLPEHSCVPNYFQAARRFEPGRHGPLAVDATRGHGRFAGRCPFALLLSIPRRHGSPYGRAAGASLMADARLHFNGACGCRMGRGRAFGWVEFFARPTLAKGECRKVGSRIAREDGRKRPDAARPKPTLQTRCGSPARLARRQHHDDLAAFEPGVLFDLGEVGDVSFDLVEELGADLLVRHLAAAIA